MELLEMVEIKEMKGAGVPHSGALCWMVELT
jgi:hypothetical protein